MNNIDFIANFFGKSETELLASLDTDTISAMVKAVEDEDIIGLHQLGYVFDNKGEISC